MNLLLIHYLRIVSDDNSPCGEPLILEEVLTMMLALM